jgi:hypothetical protein
MRKIAASITVLIATVLSFAGVNARLASTPEPEANGFVGTWQVTFIIDDRPVGLALTSFTSDGIIIGANLPATTRGAWRPDEVVLQSSSHGAWVASGERTADITFVILLSDIEGNALGTRTIRGTLELDPSGNAWSGTYTATVADTAGEVLRVSRGSVEATRIVVEPMVAPGTPAATPAA